MLSIKRPSHPPTNHPTRPPPPINIASDLSHLWWLWRHWGWWVRQVWQGSHEAAPASKFKYSPGTSQNIYKTLSDEVLGWSDKSPRTGQTETLIKCWIHRISTIFGSTSPQCLFLVRQRFAMLVEANLTPVPSNALYISKNTLKPVFVTLSFINSGKSESGNVSKWHNRDFVSWHSEELNHWHFWWIVKKQPILSQEGNISKWKNSWGLFCTFSIKSRWRKANGAETWSDILSPPRLAFNT